MLAPVGQVVDDAAKIAKAAVGRDIGYINVVHCGQINLVAVKGDAVHPRTAGNRDRRVGHPVTLIVAQHDHIAHAAPRRIKRAICGYCQDPRIDQILGEDACRCAFG
jgi:hypothetical protein